MDLKNKFCLIKSNLDHTVEVLEALGYAKNQIDATDEQTKECYILADYQKELYWYIDKETVPTATQIITDIFKTDIIIVN